MPEKKETNKGFNSWVPIFAGGGKQVDKNGRPHDAAACDMLIDKAVRTFNPEHHEPPAVVGHPKDNSPAYAWVSKLKSETAPIEGLGRVKALFAKFRDVVPEFAKAVQDGMYKKRSASFYPDGRLRHVGFLGAVPPGVKALPNMAFKEAEKKEEEIIFEFEEPAMPTVGRIMQRLRDFIIEKYDLETADRIFPRWDIDELTQRPEAQVEPAFSEPGKEDVIVPDDKKVQEKLDQQKAEFAEKISALETKVDAAKREGRQEAETEFAEKRKKAVKERQKEQIKEFCEKPLDKDGVVLPAWRKAGIAEFMEGLEVEETVEFSEGKKVSQLDWFKGLLSDLPKFVEFKEFASRGKDVGSMSKEEERETAIADFQEKNQGTSYRDAVLAVSRRHPDLFKEENN